jgi:hypothetical protein
VSPSCRLTLLRVIRPKKLVTNCLRTDDRQASEDAGRQHIVVAGNNRVSPAVDSAGDDHVVVRVARDAARCVVPCSMLAVS